MSSGDFRDKSTIQSSQTLPLSAEVLNPSPPRLPPNGRSDGKERRTPSVTPRKFRKFFTPRTLPAASNRLPLHEISAPVLNTQSNQSSPLRPFQNLHGQEDSPSGFTRELKRRKLIHTPESSPEHKVHVFAGAVDENVKLATEPQSSPCERAAASANYCEDQAESCPLPNSRSVKQRIVPFVKRGLGAQLLTRSSSSRHQYHEYPTDGLYLTLGPLWT